MDEAKQKNPPRSPNSFHSGPDGVLRPGLGDDEPPPEAYMTATEAAAKYKLKEEALESAKQEVRDEAANLERRAQEQDALEAERQRHFDDRLAALEKREEEIKARERANAT